MEVLKVIKNRSFAENETIRKFLKNYASAGFPAFLDKLVFFFFGSFYILGLKTQNNSHFPKRLYKLLYSIKLNSVAILVRELLKIEPDQQFYLFLLWRSHQDSNSFDIQEDHKIKKVEINIEQKIVLLRERKE